MEDLIKLLDYAIFAAWLLKAVSFFLLGMLSFSICNKIVPERTYGTPEK